MVEFTERHLGMIEDTHTNVIKITTVLLGANGDKGLVGKVNSLDKDHRKLSHNFWIFVSFLAGSGGIGFGVFKLLGN